MKTKIYIMLILIASTVYGAGFSTHIESIFNKITGMVVSHNSNLPDLVVSSITTDKEKYNPGDVVKITVEEKNQGKSTAGEHSSALLVDNTKLFSGLYKPNDVAYLQFKEIKSGETAKPYQIYVWDGNKFSKSSKNFFLWKCPSSGGVHHIRVIADVYMFNPNGKVIESNEKNNEKEIDVDCGKGSGGGGECIGNGGLIIENGQKCCPGLKLCHIEKDINKYNEKNIKDIHGICLKKCPNEIIHSCAKEGESISIKDGKLKCCEGLKLCPPEKDDQGIVGTCQKECDTNKKTIKKTIIQKIKEKIKDLINKITKHKSSVKGETNSVAESNQYFEYPKVDKPTLFIYPDIDIKVPNGYDFYPKNPLAQPYRLIHDSRQFKAIILYPDGTHINPGEDELQWSIKTYIPKPNAHCIHFELKPINRKNHHIHVSKDGEFDNLEEFENMENALNLISDSISIYSISNATGINLTYYIPYNESCLRIVNNEEESNQIQKELANANDHPKLTLKGKKWVVMNMHARRGLCELNESDMNKISDYISSIEKRYNLSLVEKEDDGYIREFPFEPEKFVRVDNGLIKGINGGTDAFVEVSSKSDDNLKAGFGISFIPKDEFKLPDGLYIHQIPVDPYEVWPFYLCGDNPWVRLGIFGYHDVVWYFKEDGESTLKDISVNVGYKPVVSDYLNGFGFSGGACNPYYIENEVGKNYGGYPESSVFIRVKSTKEEKEYHVGAYSLSNPKLRDEKMFLYNYNCSWCRKQ